MNFVEYLFGISPDAGNGTLEILALLLLAVALWGRVALRHSKD